MSAAPSPPPRSGPRNDVAIYSPFASGYYDRAAPQGGGAELQMTMLARELATRGWRTAHIVFPVADPVELAAPAPELSEREPYHGNDAGPAALKEAAAIWRALRRADARVYVVRGSAVYVAVVAAFCRAHRRRLVFSVANDFDLVPEPIHDSPRKHGLYVRALRRADAVIVQSTHQVELARKMLRPEQRLEFVPSFSDASGEPAAEPEAFLWVSRVVPHKQPLEFVRLARELPEARFVMVANEDVGEYEDLQRQIHTGAAELPNLELLGTLRREQVLARIERAVAIVSTSLWEGMPNVFLEAWGRSVPALSLAFDPDGLIAERDLGVAADGSWEAFVAGARTLWEDPARRAELGRNAKGYLLERHAPAAVCARWEAVLRELAPV
jgi:glycosyltransferase involved in cell wall biosynthesis